MLEADIQIKKIALDSGQFKGRYPDQEDSTRFRTL